MGLFRRREAPAEPAASPEPAEPAVAPVDPGPPAWAILPPLTPTISAPASTFKIGAAVKEDLVALDSPRLSHGMGHLVSSDGPPGVISGLARTTVQRQASTSSGGSLDMPMAPTYADPEPAAASTVFVPGLVSSGNGNGGARASADPWSPPASPISAAAAAPPPSRELLLAPAVQRQADPAASSPDVADELALESPPQPAPAPEPEPSAVPSVVEPSDPTPTEAPTVPRAGTETSLTLPPAIQRATPAPTGPTPTGGTPIVPRASDEPTSSTSVRTVQRASTEPTGANPIVGAATVPRAGDEPTGATSPAVPRAGIEPRLTLPPAVQRAGASPTSAARTVPRANTEPSGGSPT